MTVITEHGPFDTQDSLQSSCLCPDDCNCRSPYRTNYCGCKAHETPSAACLPDPGLQPAALDAYIAGLRSDHLTAAVFRDYPHAKDDLAASTAILKTAAAVIQAAAAVHGRGGDPGDVRELRDALMQEAWGWDPTAFPATAAMIQALGATSAAVPRSSGSLHDVMVDIVQGEIDTIAFGLCEIVAADIAQLTS